TPIPQQKAAEREALARAAQAFLQSGGQVQKLPGPKFTPPPLRKHPVRTAKTPRKKLLPAHVARYRESGPMILQLFERGDTFNEIARQVGRTSTFVIACLNYYGIDGGASRAAQKQAETAELQENIRLLAKGGHSTRYIAEQLGISPSKV